jgi:AcrR family transcriptional regulator
MPDHRAADRRVRRTQAHLHGALASLVHEKAYGDIAVKEILARADVARSTFYAHYQDKDDLLERGMRDLLRGEGAGAVARGACATDRILAFSLPFLDHVSECRRRNSGALAAERGAALHDRLARVLVQHVGEVIDVELRRRPDREGRVPGELLARYVASSFVATLRWWLEHPAPGAREVDAHFRSLVGPTLGATLDPPSC